jgi:hypothetical protein
MTRPTFHRISRGHSAFHLGLETYRVDHEVHLPWASYDDGSHRTWILHLGFWILAWEVWHDG